MPLRWLRDGLCARGRHAGHPFWYVRATSHHSDALLHKADWAASQDTVLQNTPPDPGHAQVIVAGRDGHLDPRPPTMRTLGEVAQRAQMDHALTRRVHTPLGAAHATAYVHARDLTVTATNRRALRTRDGHTPVQRRLCVRKERLSGVGVLPPPCFLCGGPEETPVHMHVGCAHSRPLWPLCRQAVHEAARHLPPRDKALWVASWRSAGATWTEVFCSGLLPKDAEAQLRAIARYHPPGGTSVDDFLDHMLRLGDFAWELRNHRLEQLLREPLSAAARAHRWLTAAEGDHPPPSPRPDKDFVASLRVVGGTLECPPKEGPHPYKALPGGFSRHLQDALFPPWIIGRGPMTAWEARIVGEEWARAPETPAQRYAAVRLEGWGPDTRRRPTVIRGAGPDHPWDVATGEWLQAAPGPQTGWTEDVSSLVRTPVPPSNVLHAANVLRATEIRKWGDDTATGTGAGHVEGHGPHGTALPTPSAGTARCAHATPPRRGRSGRRGTASAHTRKGHAGTTRKATGPSARNAHTAWNGIPAGEGKGHPDRTARHTQRGARGAGRGKRERHNTRYRPEPPAPAASAAHTQTGHCGRQGSSGAQRHAQTPRLGSLRASARGSHWRQASSTGLAAPAPRATTH